MADTTRFSFVELGGAQALEPSDFNTFLNRVDANLPDTAASVTGGTGVTPTYADVGVKKLTLTLDEVSVSVAAADDYGSAELVTLPDKNIVLLGAEADLALIKGDTANGLVAATDLDVALGTAAASNATLSSTMVDVIGKVDVDTDALEVDFDAHSLAASPSLLGILDGAANKIYLNVAATITADDSLTASGTVDLYYIDLGNKTS